MPPLLLHNVAYTMHHGDGMLFTFSWVIFISLHPYRDRLSLRVRRPTLILGLLFEHLPLLLLVAAGFLVTASHSDSAGAIEG